MREKYSVLIIVLFLTVLDPRPCSSATPSLAKEAAQSADQSRSKGGVAPESFEELTARADAAMSAEQIPEAIRLYGRAVKLRPNWSEGWWNLGTLTFDAGRFDEARNAFEHFLTTEREQRGPGFAMLGLTEFQLKQYDRALANIERGLQPSLQSDPAFIRTVLIHDGMLNARFAKPEIALKRLTLATNQIAAAHPEAPNVAVLADDELLDALGVASLQMQVLPSDLSREEKPLVRQAGRAQALIAMQDRVAAAAEFQSLLAEFSSKSGVNYMYGVFLLKEHPSKAAGAFKRELEITPSHVPSRIQLALQSLETAEYEAGLRYAKEALALSPRNFVTRIACGRLYLGLGKTGLALKELRIAVKLAPGSPDAHFALSRALADAGHTTEAAHERAEFERLKALSDAANR
jgi:tetratricopeptide (TPR) repeat protein